MTHPVQAAAITGVASAFPSGSVPTSEVAARLGVAPEWIVKRTGIAHRYRATADERLTDWPPRPPARRSSAPKCAPPSSTSCSSRP